MASDEANTNLKVKANGLHPVRIRKEMECGNIRVPVDRDFRDSNISRASAEHRRTNS